MGRFAVLVLVGAACIAARAQQPCEFFSDQARQHLTQALQDAPSCKAAAAQFDKCRWGSSVDWEFGSIVVGKCEKELLPALSAAGKANYEHELRLCSYEYEHQEGTVFISEDARCKVHVAADLDANVDIADQPPARASFDCGKAQTAMEQAMCSDQRLGDAEIVLSRALHGAMSALKPDQQRALTRQENDWFSGVEKKCRVGADAVSARARACMRKEFEARFQELDGCSAGETAACLKLPETGGNP